MKFVLLAVSLAAGLSVSSLAAAGEFEIVSDQSRFQAEIVGKELRLQGYGPIVVRLTVLPDGEIEGRGMGWPVTGQWQWQDGFFCRHLDWGGSDLGQNCQAVLLFGQTVRFVSDQGQGDFANFRLQ